MANILDIFRSHAGDKLIEKSCEETGLTRREAERAFLYTLPTLLSVLKRQFEDGDNRLKQVDSNINEFVTYSESEDLINPSEAILQVIISANQKEKICGIGKIIDINEAALEKILKISIGALFSIITEISNKKYLKKEDQISLIYTLAGINQKFDKEFIKVLIKNDEDAHLIDSEEEIALGRNDKNDDQSILGGYSGGR